MGPSKFDAIYRSVVLSKLFAQGWGSPELLKRLLEFRKVFVDRQQSQHFVPSDYPIIIDKFERHSDHHIMEGHFISPFTIFMPDMIPYESQTAYFQAILPNQWRSKLRPVVIHLAGTGDHRFWRRRALLAKPLLREASVASIILENPFYGVRKPSSQVRSSLRNVSDVFIMGACLSLESAALLHWCEREGFGPLGVTGISLGGHMASIAASIWPKPVALIPCLSWTTASCVFTQGVMSGSVSWTTLEHQLKSNEAYRDQVSDNLKYLRKSAAFEAGREFVRHFPDALTEIGEIHREERQTKASRQPELRSSTETDKRQWTGSSSASEVILDMKLILSRVTEFFDHHQLIPFAQTKLTDVLSITKDTDDAVQFMRGVMDEFTHLGNFPAPIDPNLVVIVTASDDAYVLREGVDDLTKVWPGSEVRLVEAGHISAFLFKQHTFRKAIIDSLDKAGIKYYGAGIR